jgi:hypothetical protein
VLYPRFAHVVHLVREPETHISSFTAHSNKTYDFVLHTMRNVLPHLENKEVGYAAAPLIQQFEKVWYAFTVQRALQRITRVLRHGLVQARLVQDSCVRGEACHLHFAALTWLHWNRFVHR